MRILHLIPNLSGGGAERQLSYLSPMLVQMGHSVHLAFSKEGPEMPKLNGVVLHKLKSRSNHDPYLLWQIVHLIRRVKPDIVQTWILQMDILGGIAALINRVSWVFREPNSTKAYPRSWKHFLRIHLGSMASAIASNSQGGNEYWATHLPSSRRFIVSNGLPIHELSAIKPALPIYLLTKSETPIVLYAGRFEETQKRPGTLLKALAYVNQKKRVFAILCGEGPQRLKLEKLSHRLGLSAHIHFTGYLPAASIWALMKKAAAFVSLSAYEGCPNTVLEAMACGCPVILSNIQAHREILDESCAVFVDPTNIQQVAKTLLKVLGDPIAMQKRALIAKQRVQQYSIAKMADKWENVYRECIYKCY
jgi:glycosyltransferase involved in cell wall biosynthesis